MTLFDFLTAARRERGWSIPRLARECRVSSQLVYKWLAEDPTYRITPGPASCEKIAAALGVDNLFTTRERLPLSTRRVREIFAELGESARVPNAHPHRTRHTSASAFLAQRPGAELQLRSRLGHLGREILSDYVSWSDPSQHEAAEVASLSTRWNL